MSFKDLTKRAEAALKPEPAEAPAKKLDAKTSGAEAKKKAAKPKIPEQ